MVHHQVAAYGGNSLPLSVMRIRPCVRGEDDVRYCNITCTQVDHASNLSGAVNTLVKALLVHHGGTQTPPPPQ